MSMIEFEKDGTSYTLEFDRKTCEIAERSLGLSLSDVMSGKLTYLPVLFQAAMRKHHPSLKHTQILEILNSMGDKMDLYQALVTMYADCVSTLVDEPEEGKATSWKLV